MAETAGEMVSRIINLEPFFRDHGQRLYWEQTNNETKTRFVFWRTAQVGPGDFDGFDGDVVFLGDTMILPGTFGENCQVKNINFGNFIFELDRDICAKCATLESVKGKSVVSIGQQAFFLCERLKRVSFPSLSEAESWVFEQTAISTAVFPLLKTIPQGMFLNCRHLKEAVFPVATRVGTEAFFGCELMHVTHFPNVRSVSMKAFTSCESLETVNFPLLEKTDVSSFSYCTSLKTVLLPKLKTVSMGSFEHCTALTTVQLSSLEEASEWLFLNCTSLTTVYLPLVQKVASDAFSGCVKLQQISISSHASIQDDTLENVPSTELIPGHKYNLRKQSLDSVDYD